MAVGKGVEGSRGARGRGQGPAFGLRDAGLIGVVGAAGLVAGAAGNALTGSAMGAATVGWLFTSLAGDSLAHRLGRRRVFHLLVVSGIVWVAAMGFLRAAAGGQGAAAAAAAAALAATAGLLRSKVAGASGEIVGVFASIARWAWVFTAVAGPALLLAYGLSPSRVLLEEAALALSVGPLAEELFWAAAGRSG
ncbi:hypothetical protein CF15_01470 [Pyrodictium occultum]|uniref:Uncharacterized protein n=1 Tax=Pyrodictium occultum TaxID=2309 RepID=A0A0V8RTZ9_PYROC|nr:hypothetical protein [Pyrodictium occultum]KSW11536.1 hypothetical protein CF15_01470 [Pyrodictium occultum]